jgi:UDP-N-acetylmuramate dehydrogenase
MMAATATSGERGELRLNEPMSKHTSWRVGGPAETFFVPNSLEDLSLFLHELNEAIPVFWFGCTQLARQCVRWGLGPSEFFAGIPGTVGGALAMNAGAHGGETWDRVESVRTIDRSGKIHERAPGEYTVGYRSVTGPKNEWFIEATLRFEADVTPSAEDMKSMLERRKRTQPLGLPSCGSVFRNPPGDHAARLIEAAGLKGFSIGGAEVSRKHANFIINSDNATASDVEALIGHVRQAVFEKHGVELIHEVRIVGEVAK